MNNIIIEFLILILMVHIIIKEFKNEERSPNKIVILLASSSILALLIANIIEYI